MLTSTVFPKDIDLLTATIEELQDHLMKGNLTSVHLVEEYLVSGIRLRCDHGSSEWCGRRFLVL